MKSSFEVEIPESGVCFQVSAQQSIVEAAAQHGVEILTGCTDGKCGTCVVKVLEGQVDHRDTILTPEKRASGWMCACVSRALSQRLRLEIW